MDKFDIIIGRLETLEGKIDKMATDGCAKASVHSDHELRIRSIETTLMKANGAALALTGIAGLAGTIGGWFASHLKGQ